MSLVNHYSRAKKQQLISYPEDFLLKMKFPQGCWYQVKLNPSDEASFELPSDVATSIPNGIISAENCSLNLHIQSLSMIVLRLY